MQQRRPMGGVVVCAPSRASTLPQGQGGDLVFVGAALAAMLSRASTLPDCRCGNQAAIGGLGGLDGLLSLPLSSGLPSPSLLAVNHGQSAGVSSGRPCRARALAHCALYLPCSQEASTSRQTLGRLGWMVQREYLPISQSSATQRTGAEWVPR